MQLGGAFPRPVTFSSIQLSLTTLFTCQHFNNVHDDEMLALIQSHTDKIVVPIPAENVCFMGGSVRCLSWQVKGANKANILQ